MSSNTPTRVLARVTISNTSLVDFAIAFAKDHLNEMGFNHVMRSFLIDFCLAFKDPKCSSRDLEAHVVNVISTSVSKSMMLTQRETFSIAKPRAKISIVSSLSRMLLPCTARAASTNSKRSKSRFAREASQPIS